jgi:glycosyltransferase involved in cell wall biosynthesis
VFKILILYSSVTDYALSCFEELAIKNEVIIVTNSVLNEAPYDLSFTKNITIIKREDVSNSDLLYKSKEFNPDIIYISGWTDRAYLTIGSYFKKFKKKIVMSLDNPWQSTIRQIFGLIYFRILLSKSFTNVLVAGLRQYEFARKLGFSYSQILIGMYSARVDNFNKIDINARYDKTNQPKVLLYVGRLVTYKRVEELYNSFTEVKRLLGDKCNWELHIYGDGPLSEALIPNEHIKLFNFQQPKDLPTIISKAHAFCLPSELENWGVTIHEMASSGLVLIVSEHVLSREQYVINGYNGIVFEKDLIESALLKLISYSDTELMEMSKASRELSVRMTPKIWASNFLSLIS